MLSKICRLTEHNQPIYSTISINGRVRRCLPDQRFESGEWNFRILCILRDCLDLLTNWKWKKIIGESAFLIRSCEMELRRTVPSTSRSDAFSGTTTSTYQYIEKKKFMENRRFYADHLKSNSEFDFKSSE